MVQPSKRITQKDAVIMSAPLLGSLLFSLAPFHMLLTSIGWERFKGADGLRMVVASVVAAAASTIAIARAQRARAPVGAIVLVGPALAWVANACLYFVSMYVTGLAPSCCDGCDHVTLFIAGTLEAAWLRVAGMCATVGIVLGIAFARRHVDPILRIDRAGRVHFADRVEMLSDDVLGERSDERTYLPWKLSVDGRLGGRDIRTLLRTLRTRGVLYVTFDMLLDVDPALERPSWLIAHAPMLGGLLPLRSELHVRVDADAYGADEACFLLDVHRGHARLTTPGSTSSASIARSADVVRRALVGRRAGIRIAPADDATLEDVLRIFASVDRLGLGTGVPALVADSREAERACREAR